ncbi:MAG: Eco57I restriction-modification methylase domain-containing protein, partial [Prevotella sp.]
MLISPNISNNLEKVKALIDKYEANRSYYHSPNYNETLLRSDFLDPLFEALGWDIKNIAGRSISEREVLLEESLRDGMMEHTKKPDYTFRLFSERKFFLEAKKPSVNILQNNGPAQQVRRYGFTAGLKISVLSNFEDLSIYDMTIPVTATDGVEKARIRTFHYTQYVNEFSTLCRLLGRNSVYDGSFDEEWRCVTGEIDRTAPVDDYLLKQVDTWRLKLGREIHSVLPEMDPEGLNDCVQSYINKILFLRVCEDRNIEEYKALLSIAQRGSFDRLIDKFVSSDKKYNSGLFASTAADKIISENGNAFWEIIRQLYFPESPYSFSVLSSDILGRIYEMFLSEKLQFNEGQVLLEKKPENVDKDVVTTPTFVIRALLSKTVRRMCQGKSVEEIKEMSFADIACGSGAFLLELFGLLCELAVEYYLTHDKSALIQTSVDTYRLRFEYKKDILVSCIYGVDKDYNAVEATKFGLLLKLLEDEDVNSLSNEHPILPNLDNNIFWGNSLIESNNTTNLDEQSRVEINPFDFNGMKFDLIIGNPPYMKTEDMKNINKKEFPLYKKIYQTAYKQFDKYFLFIERGLSLLKDEGMLAFIVPNKFMKVDAGTSLRSMIAEGRELVDLTSFGANLVFSDKSTYTSLLVLSKIPNDSFQYTEVNNIEGWIAKNPAAFSSGIKNSAVIGRDVWILYPNSLENVYQRITDNTVSLSSIVGEENIFNGIQTSAVKTYVVSPISMDVDYVYFQHDGKDYKVEKKYTRPFFKTSRGDDMLNAYRTFKSN